MDFSKLNKYSVKNFFLIFLFIYFFFGLSTLKDYGTSWDEGISRQGGFITGNYILKKILPEHFYTNYKEKLLIKKNRSEKEVIQLHEYQFNHMGYSYDIIVNFLEIVFNIKDENIYQFRHLFNFLFFFLGVIFFYKFIRLKFQSPLAPLFACMMLVLNPRIYAHSFFNPKDTVFLTLFIISNFYGYNFTKTQKFKDLILFSLTSAFLINMRILGILVPAVYCLFFLINFYLSKKKELIKNFFFIFFTTTLLLYIIWPLLWENPYFYGKKILNIFLNFDNSLEIKYFGELISSNQKPWYYSLVWVAITLPELYLVAFVLGIVCYFLRIDLNKKKQEKQIYDNLIFIFYLLIPIALSIFSKNLYNGWRHFYFLTFPIIYFSIFAFDSLRKNTIRKIIILIFIANFTYISYIINKIHPYQYLYFNNIYKKNHPLLSFEKDYWGISNVNLIKGFLKKNADLNISKNNYYYIYSGSNLPLSLKTLPNEIQKKFILIEKQDEIKFNKKNIYYFYNFNNNYPKDFFLRFDPVYEIYFDKILINGVYISK